MNIAIKLAGKYGVIDIPLNYTELNIDSGLIHSYIEGLEPHQVPKSMTFIPTLKETVVIKNKEYPVWVLLELKGN